MSTMKPVKPLDLDARRDYFTLDHRAVRPVQNFVLLQPVKPGVHTTPGGLHLPVELIVKEPIALVRAVGPDVTICAAGDEVIYRAAGSYTALNDHLDSARLLLVRETAIEAVLGPVEQPAEAVA